MISYDQLVGEWALISQRLAVNLDDDALDVSDGDDCSRIERSNLKF
jgi:hypothetical protein